MDEWIVFGVLALSLAMFVVGFWRYDVVAILALLTLTVVGIVPAADSFTGFGHPAVITVAGVLILSRTLQNSGIVDILAKHYSRIPDIRTVRILSLSSLTAFLSAFMNNIGAVSILMPVAIRVSNRSKQPPSLFLMPLAFASLLGGLVTLIGTPPNIIISKFRQEESGTAFQMFDFAPVGIAVAAAGVLFIAFIGWRLLPSRNAPTALGDALHIEDYITEVRVPANSRFVGKLIRDLEELAEENVTIAGLLHRGRVFGAPSSYQNIDADDVLILEADPDELRNFIAATGFILEGTKDISDEVDQSLDSYDVATVEAIVTPDSPANGRTARALHLHANYGVNLLGLSRRGSRLVRRMGQTRFRSGDILLLQGQKEQLQNAMPQLGLMPLAERDLRIGQQRQIIFPLAVFAIAVLLAAFNVVPIHIAFVSAAVILILSRFLTLQEAYQTIDWPVIVLLGAMIPVGEAMETTGGAARIATLIVDLGEAFPAWAMLAIMLVTSMLLSALINNAAAVILMAPIGIAVAHTMGANTDPFLMAVAIGGSSAFLSPIGHQSNTIVMGPGGYRFGDYWRMGLPLAAIIVVVAVPLLMWIWPLHN